VAKISATGRPAGEFRITLCRKRPILVSLRGARRLFTHMSGRAPGTGSGCRSSHPAVNRGWHGPQVLIALRRSHVATDAVVRL
jgi:hypothetical protein